MEDGLPSNTIYYVFFDFKGYMWVATSKGLARYNGTKFKIFTTYDGLPDNEIFGLNEDYEGRLWITTFKGVLCYYKDNKFYTEKNAPWLKLKSGIDPNFFGRFRLQKDSSLLTESPNGLHILQIKHQTLKLIPLTNITHGHVLSRPVLQEKIDNNAYHIYYWNTTFIIDSQSHIKKEIPYKDNQGYTGASSAHAEYLATSKGIYTPSMQHLLTRKIDSVDRYSAVTVFTKGGFFLICTKYGLLYNKDNILFQGNYITSVDQDNLGNFWVSTLKNGLFCISKNFEKTKDISVNGKIATSIYTADQVNHFITQNGSFYSLKNNGANKVALTLNHRSKENLLLDKTNTCITNEGDILHFQDEKIYYKEKRANQFKQISIYPNETLGRPVKCIYYFNSTFYISSRMDILAIPVAMLRSQQKIDFKDIIKFKSASLDRIFYSAWNSLDSSFWFSRVNEMYSYKNDKIAAHPELVQHTFRQFNFYKEYLVGSTDDNKLFVYNTKSHKLDSLPNTNLIWANIYQINDQSAIIGTNNYYKILRLLPPDKKGKAQYSLQTIDNPFIPKDADYIFADSSRYYFQKNGLLSGTPNDILSEGSHPPIPVFISVKTANTVYNNTDDVIRLGYGEAQRINISIDKISYSSNEIFTQYSISRDSTDNWNPISGDEINLNASTYGKYAIKLRCKTISSAFSRPIVLRLEVGKPYWVTWWFITLSITIFLFSIYLMIRLMTQRQLRKTQKEHSSEMKFLQSEYKALNALMNPHFIFNSLNNIQSLINKNNNDTANQYLVIFSKLIRQNMMNISKGFVSLYQELQLVENYLNLEKLRFKSLINFSITVDEDVDTEEIMISPLLIQPLVENAIIHGLLPRQSENSKLEIKVFEIDNVLHIQIIDNGIGIIQSLKSKHSERESYGLTNLNRRIEHLQKIQKREIEFEVKELYDDAGKSLGTMSSIKINLMQV